MNLHESIARHAGHHAKTTSKHLKAVGINDWADLTKVNLMALRDELRDTLSPNSGKTICAALCAFLHRFEEENLIPCKTFAEVLKVRGDKPIKTYLTMEELERLENVRVTNDNERYVLTCFMASARLGMRHSDIIRIETSSIVNGYLTYSSQKTHVVATIPCSERTRKYIEEIQRRQTEPTLATYNSNLRRLAKRAGITEKVSIHKAGKDYTKEKWECLSSHSARITFCTCMSELGVPIVAISHMAGHTNPNQTSGYICRTTPKLNEAAMEFFK